MKGIDRREFLKCLGSGITILFFIDDMSLFPQVRRRRREYP